jgi:hypothetical protein
MFVKYLLNRCHLIIVNYEDFLDIFLFKLEKSFNTDIEIAFKEIMRK